LAFAAIPLAKSVVPAAEPAPPLQVMTVLGPVPASKLGRTLIHEHVTTDFLGAEKLPAPRYDRDRAVETILPRLLRLKERDCQALVECTPAYIGRDVMLLKRLAMASGIHLVTNTGYYGAVENKYLPRHAFAESEEKLADRWFREWREGIENTGIRPGFIKLGTGGGKLPELHAKLVRAAARVHLRSGLTIAIHTGDGVAALDELRILEGCGVAPEAFIWVHAQNDPGPAQLEVARRGGWVSLDGFSETEGLVERYRDRLATLQRAGLLRRALISHDDGWAVEGEAPGGSRLKLFGNGNAAPYSAVFTKLLPTLQSAGFSADDLAALLTRNPAEALAVRVRKV
jgi:phosphotriesterase-related protein